MTMIVRLRKRDILKKSESFRMLAPLLCYLLRANLQNNHSNIEFICQIIDQLGWLKIQRLFHEMAGVWPQDYTSILCNLGLPG